MIQLFSYVVTHDLGFAPNPFGRYLTFTAEQAQLRQTANIGDWLLGTGVERSIGKDRVIYASEIAEILSYEDYSKDDRFDYKVPADGPESWHWRGDNLHYRDEHNRWQQHPSELFKASEAKQAPMEQQRALICRYFFYFGISAPLLPRRFHTLLCEQPPFQCNKDSSLIAELQGWLRANWTAGMLDRPALIGVT